MRTTPPFVFALVGLFVWLAGCNRCHVTTERVEIAEPDASRWTASVSADRAWDDETWKRSGGGLRYWIDDDRVFHLDQPFEASWETRVRMEMFSRAARSDTGEWVCLTLPFSSFLQLTPKPTGVVLVDLVNHRVYEGCLPGTRGLDCRYVDFHASTPESVTLGLYQSPKRGGMRPSDSYDDINTVITVPLERVWASTD